MAIKSKPLNDDQRAVFTDLYRWFEQFHAMDGTPQDWLAAWEDAKNRFVNSKQGDLLAALIGAAIDWMEDAQRKKYIDAVINQSEQTVMEIDGKAVRT